MNISIFGLGYVGGVTAACLANDGHVIVGVDVQEAKVEAFNAGVSPIVEPCLDDLLKAAKNKGHLKATTSVAAAIAETELSIVCVGTPSKVSGALDLSFVHAVVGEIGEAVRRKGQKHTLVLRSTMLPGSTQRIVRELLSDLTDRSLLAVYYYPEFLREGTGVADYQNPALIVVGTSGGGKPSQALMDTLFGGEAMVVDWPTAEMVKYACNAFHATKIAFANEMGRIGKQMGVDPRAVMDLLCRDTKLNLSSYYLKPGNPFGGSCLPKDVRALTQEVRTQGLSLPLLENLLPSNERHLQTLLGIITDSGQKEVCLLGLAFKPNTDDLREAPMVEVAQILLGRGFTIRIYDPALNLSALVGANKRLVDTRMPHLAALLRTDLGSALGNEGMVIATQKCASLSELEQHLTGKHHVLDVNGWPELALLPSRYEGLCW